MQCAAKQTKPLGKLPHITNSSSHSSHLTVFNALREFDGQVDRWTNGLTYAVKLTANV